MKAFVLDATWDPRPGYRPSPSEVETRKALIGSSVWRYPRAQFKEVEKPEPGPSDVIIKLRRVGFCGSDLHFFETDADGYILSKGGAKTNISGVFHAGDVQDRTYRQAITASGAGCMAAMEAERFLEAEGH